MIGSVRTLLQRKTNCHESNHQIRTKEMEEEEEEKSWSKMVGRRERKKEKEGESEKGATKKRFSCNDK